MSEIRHVIRLTVSETVQYEIDLEVDDLEEFPQEILDDPAAVEEWLIDNEDAYVDQIGDSSFVGCDDRQVAESKVLKLRRKAA